MKDSSDAVESIVDIEEILPDTTEAIQVEELLLEQSNGAFCASNRTAINSENLYNSWMLPQQVYLFVA